jgi:predicted transcriptional regulator
MSDGFQEHLYDILFEVSSEDRHKILLLLLEEPSNLTQLSTKSKLNLPETRRHISRLMEVDLVERNPNGSYFLTYFGNCILELIEEMSFYTQHKEYFLTHSLEFIPTKFRMRLRDFSNSEFIDNVLNFIRRIEQVIKEADKEIWLLVDQFPLNFLSLILEAIERGVRLKIIEPSDRVLNPDLEALASEESLVLEKMRATPLVEQRMLDDIDLYMYISEKDCLVSFPTIEKENDYKGFKSMDNATLDWSHSLFQQYWEMARRRGIPTPIIDTQTSQKKDTTVTRDSIIIVGQEKPEYDAQLIQDAVDNYDEVILRGRFNIGTSTILIKKSTVLRGEGRMNDIPDTKIYKKGWNFPFVSQEFLIIVRGDDIDVSIENIHFENFNGTCINTTKGNSVTIRKNRITLLSGLGRGLTFGTWGDHIVGITAGGDNLIGGFPGGQLIEDNYLDFALSYGRGGFISNEGFEKDPEYRPDLKNHEYYICVGVNICRNKGKVTVRNNTIRNMNSRGILVFDNWENSEINIHDNIITSEVFGAYPYKSPMAGVGIFIQSAWSEPRSGGKVDVFNNKIFCEKINYCGIAVHGPSMYAPGAGKLTSCSIKNNKIEIMNGLYGLQIRKSDHTTIINNVIKGSAYYGIQISGSKSRNDIDLQSKNNIIADNNLEEIRIKPPDDYSDNHIDNYIFTGSGKKSKTAHVWLNPQTSNNSIKIKPAETFIDEGENNKIIN